MNEYVPNPRSVVRQRPACPPSLGRPVCYAYLDAPNNYLGAASFSAFRLGMAPSPRAAAEGKIFDPLCRVRFKCLRHFVVGDDPDNLARTVCVGSQKVGADAGVWRAAERDRWATITPMRTSGRREKEVDTTLVAVPLDDLLRPEVSPGAVEVTILSGDRDMLPLVQILSARGFQVDVIAWRHTVSPLLVKAAHRFLPLDGWFDQICFREGQP